MIDTSSVIPSHEVANWLLSVIDSALNALGLSNYATVETIIYVVAVMCLALAVGWTIKTLVLLALRKIVSLRHGQIGQELLRERTMTKCAHVIPPMVFLALIPFAFNTETKLLVVLERLALVYTFIALGVGICAVLTFVYNRYDQRENTRNLPLKGILNIAKGIVWLVIVVISVSALVDKSPAVLLTGLGAFAAALMLIFKDGILGFVAGVQMSQNDMLHVGDWIVVPGTPADGIVIDVSLTAVKVRNFDNTIVTVPPYTLVSTSFRNYRGMTESGARRFTRTITFIVDSVVPCTDEMIKSLEAKYPLLSKFVDSLHAAGVDERNDTGLTPVNGSIATNLGLFRAYCSLYLLSLDDIAKDQQILVRLLDPTHEGLVLQIYAFTTTTDWEAYESIHGAVMEHLNVAARDFGLAVYTRARLQMEQMPAPAASTTAPQA